MTFESEDPAFGGTMTITTRLMLVRDGTKVTFVAENVPPGISESDQGPHGVDAEEPRQPS
ncbi:hypothetical protein [Novosphingobium pokkalii]|uniref:Uncharacterized protein n=1 Tax=Novosphingobium pokkalii TaxID=1770194 RepID=A0ABV7V8L4_9SPHN|nr:hypothetical protein [Novosphingobium pokkalii]GHD03628.1 hypothetical protein GCM10019060_39860 [Novosphingobium pokkalii]